VGAWEVVAQEVWGCPYQSLHWVRDVVFDEDRSQRTGENPMTAVPGQYQRVVIRGSAIEVISVEYRPKRQRNASVQSAPGRMTRNNVRNPR